MKFGKAIPREITITPTTNMGFVVHSGCCIVCFKHYEDLIKALTDYLADPEGFEKDYQRSGGSSGAPVPQMAYATAEANQGQMERR